MSMHYSKAFATSTDSLLAHTGNPQYRQDSCTSTSSFSSLPLFNIEEDCNDISITDKPASSSRDLMTFTISTLTTPAATTDVTYNSDDINLHRRRELIQSLQHTMDLQYKANARRSYLNQRVTLSPTKTKDMNMATLSSAINRMSRFRYTNQDCKSQSTLRTESFEKLFDSLDRLDMPALSKQRFVAKPKSVVEDPQNQQQKQQQ